ncbi:MAG: polysaccharide deacetylase family protein, partial [Candidatus Weimeria sp.]
TMLRKFMAAVMLTSIIFTSTAVTAAAQSTDTAAKTGVTAATGSAAAATGSSVAVTGSAIADTGSAVVTTGPSVVTTGPAVVYAKIRLVKKSVKLYPDETFRLSVKWKKGKHTKLTWKSSDTRIVKVSKHGNLRALYPGKAKVTVTTAKGSTATATVTVKKPDMSKAVYLTFDDGPGSKVTPQLLAVLKKYNVKATFFIVGSQAKGHEDLLRRIVKDGHTLAIHTYTHDYRKIYSSAKAYIEDFNKTEKLIKDATGVQPKYFRFPGGGNNHYMSSAIRSEVLKQLHARGYTEMDWNATTGDAAPTYYSADKLIYNGKNSHWGRGSVVMLQHDSNPKYRTPAVTEALIRYYRSKGCTFYNLDHYYGEELCFKK